jgi:hypothetical protein
MAASTIASRLEKRWSHSVALDRGIESSVSAPRSLHRESATSKANRSFQLERLGK